MSSGESWAGAGGGVFATTERFHAAVPIAGDGWIGTREFPGYRAGRVVVRLADLPGVDGEHLHFDLLLLDERGQTDEVHSGRCHALQRSASLDERSRLVCLCAELLRDAPDDERGLSTLGQALNFIRANGVSPQQMVAAAQLLDAACNERAVAASVARMLRLSLGEDESQAVLRAEIERLPANKGGSRPAGDTPLPEQLRYLIRQLGKDRIRRHLRAATDFDLVPSADMFGL